MADVQIEVINTTENVVNVAVPGVQGPVGSTGSVTIAQAGTAAEPGIRFESDTNTGIYSPGADQLAVSTGGTGRLFVDSAGLLGLGTSSPGTKLDIANNFSFGTASSNVIRLGASYSGGTSTSPSSIGAITWASNDTASEHGRINVAIINPSTSNNSQLEFWINNSGISQAMTLTPTGLGIGTTSPTTLLDVNADTVRVRTARTPASATATGATGEICWDANYIYVCTATNTWKRSALSTW